MAEIAAWLNDGAVTVMNAAVGVSPAGLSPREIGVLGFVAAGMTDDEIAERLFISPRTINTHLTDSFAKLGVSSRAVATRYAMAHGLVNEAMPMPQVTFT